MARSQGRPDSSFPYHVGARCINKEWFNIPMNQVWEIMSEQLHFLHHAFGVEIISFVLMSNHFHLIVRTPRSNLSEAMAWFMRETSRALTRAGNRINQTYGGPHYRSLIVGGGHNLAAYKYVYYNPVAAGICADVLHYEFSTLPGLLGIRPLYIPVAEDLTLFSDVEGTLAWLNKEPKKENWHAVRRALKKAEFKFARDNSRPHELEREAL